MEGLNSSENTADVVEDDSVVTSTSQPVDGDITMVQDADTTEANEESVDQPRLPDSLLASVDTERGIGMQEKTADVLIETVDGVIKQRYFESPG